METEGKHEVHIPITVYQEDGNPLLLSSQSCPMDGKRESSVDNNPIIVITPDTSQSPETSDDSGARERCSDQVYAYLKDDGQGNFTLVNEHSYNKVPSDNSSESDSILNPGNCPVYLISEDGQATPLDSSKPANEKLIGGRGAQNVVVVELHSPGEDNKCGGPSHFDESSILSTTSEDNKSGIVSFSSTVKECLKRKQKSPKKIVRLCNLSKQKSAPKTVMTTHTEPALDAESMSEMSGVISEDSNSQFSVSGYVSDNTENSSYFQSNFPAKNYGDGIPDYHCVMQPDGSITLLRNPALPASHKAFTDTPTLSKLPPPIKVEPLDLSDYSRVSNAKLKLVPSHTIGQGSGPEQVIFPNVKRVLKPPSSSRTMNPLCTSTPLVPEEKKPQRTPSSVKGFSTVQSLLTTPTSSKAINLCQKVGGIDRLVGEPAVARRVLIPTVDLQASQMETQYESEVNLVPSGAPKSAQTPLTNQRGKDFDPGPTDDSLTNIQWLGKMSGQNLSMKETQKINKSRPTQYRPTPTITQIIASEQQIEKVGQECGIKKRPPYSYMHLIQMAISSKADKRMTLKEIYHWIDAKFPYYRYSSKQGWKNSIRHNLSLYDIFVREKPHIAGKSGSSYWTLRSDLKNKNSKTVRYASLDTGRDRDQGATYLHLVGGGLAGASHLIQMASSASSSPSSTSTPSLSLKPRKGPAPLLPKLPPLQPSPHLQAYALIPIPAGMPVVAPPSQMVVSGWPPPSTANSIPTLNTSNSSFISVNSSQQSINASLTLKRSSSVSMGIEPNRKHVKIAPKASILNKSSSRRRQRTNSRLASSSDTSDLQMQLSQMRFDSGIASDMSSCDSPALDQVSTNKTPSGQSKNRNRRSRKDKPVVLRDCDEDDSLGAQPNLYKDINEENKPPLIEVKEECEDGADELPFSLSDSDQGFHISLNENALFESGFHDLLATLEMPSPGKVLRTPPKPTDQCLSQGLMGTPLSPWISPIRNATSFTDESRLLDGFFTPNGKLATSTPNGSKSTCRTQQSDNGVSSKSPRIGSLRDLGLPGLTPLKGNQRSPSARSNEGGSPNTSVISNRSFQKLLGDFHLDSMMDQVDDGLDIASFNLFQC